MLVPRHAWFGLAVVAACSADPSSDADPLSPDTTATGTSNAVATMGNGSGATTTASISSTGTTTTNQAGMTTTSAGATGGGTDGNGGSDSTNASTTGTTGAGGTTSSSGSSGGSGGSGASQNGPVGTPVEGTAAAMPFPRGEHGVAALNDEVYVLGGFTPSVTASVQVYSPETDSWRDAADFPVVFHHPNVASLNGQLYVLGFHAGNGQRAGDGRSFVYDPLTDAWSPLTSMPLGTERGASCVTTFEGKIYVFGGTNDVALAESSVYDPAEDSWQALPLLPAFRHHCVAAAIGDKIYIVSGRDVVIQEVQSESYVYDPVARTYQEVAPIPTPRGGAAGGVLAGRIYVFGGEGNTNDPMQIFHEIEEYDPVSDSWRSLPDMDEPRHGLGGAVIGDRIYLPGGSTSIGIDAQTTHSVFYFEPT